MGLRLIAALLASLVISSHKDNNSRGNPQRTDAIDGTAIANSPNEGRTIPSLYSKPIFSSKTEQFCSSARAN
jgi:hypothetical protein